MLSARNARYRLETMAWVTDDEAEFWTGITPTRTTHGARSESRKSAKNKESSVSNDTTPLPDGLHFKFDNPIEEQHEDHLFEVYKKTAEEQAREAEIEAEKTKLSEIFERTPSNDPQENAPGMSMTFLDRLFHQISEPTAVPNDDRNEEEYSEIDENEVTTVTNDRAALFNNSIDHIPSPEPQPWMERFRGFVQDLDEEKDVILGKLDDETLFNRRSHRAQLSLSLQKKIRGPD